MTETLKPCPFCGASPRQITSSEMLTWCVNQKCRLRGMGFSKEEWNTRPSDAVLEAAQKFFDKVTEIEPHINARIALQAARGYPYTGPNWKIEYDALAALLKESPQ